MYITGVKLQKNIADRSSYVFSLPVIRNLDQLKLNKKITFFVGENGTGKSTLLEAIAVNMGFNAEGGTRNFNFASKETHSPLHQSIVVVKGVRRPRDGFFLRAESFYNVATEVDRLEDIRISTQKRFIDNYGGKSLHNQSHGESFMSLVLNRFRGNSLFILDEPEAALSPTRQLSLMVKINELEKQNCQFIISTHSPILLAYPNADIFVLNDSEIRLTVYENTEHYTITKQFLNNTEKMLSYLFEENC
ncbi:AAA family ATPase [Ruminiclostridium sufflavum]|nr:AAA family ATPase [Ruminiclostridium sufflavum]